MDDNSKSIDEDSKSNILNQNILKQLKELQNNIQKISSLYNDLYSYIGDIISKSNASNNFDNEIKSYINWIDNKINNKKEEDISKEKLNETFNNAFKEYCDIYENKHFKNIYQSIEELKNIIDELNFSFDPPTINNFTKDKEKDNKSVSNSNSNTSTYDIDRDIESKLYSNFYGDSKSLDNNENQTDNPLKCYIKDCPNIAVYYCPHCSNYLCEQCYDQCKINEKDTHHKFVKMNEEKIRNEQNKMIFLESFINLLRNMIYKCNYIIKNENQNYSDPDTFKAFQYPFIQNENIFGNQIQFLIDINELYEIIQTKIDDNKKINEKEICDKLTTSLENIFGRENKLELNNKFSGEADDDDDDFYDERDLENEENEKKEDTNIKSINDKFHYIVNIINKKNNKNEDINNKEILEKIIQALSIKEDDISIMSNNNSIFINNFIKSPIFSRLPPKQIKIKYPGLHCLYDYKLILDGLIRLQCGIPEGNLDYRYNFIIPNLSLNNKRGSEIYNPPYGWLGIGLNVKDKYDNDDNSWLNKNNNLWAIAYYGFGKNLENDKLRSILKDIILDNKFLIEQHNKCDYNDIRHNGEKVGKGICLSPNINIAEKNCGIFHFNNKKYKIVLMSKVLIENIREPDHYSFWVINNEKDIKIYKILIKEIN